MDASVSQVISSIVSLLHHTLTIEMTLFLNSFILWSTIATDCTSKDKSSLSSTSGASEHAMGLKCTSLTWRHERHHEFAPNLVITLTDRLPVQSSQESWMGRYTEGSTYLASEIELLQILILFSEYLHNFSNDLEPP